MCNFLMLLMLVVNLGWFEKNGEYTLIPDIVQYDGWGTDMSYLNKEKRDKQFDSLNMSFVGNWPFGPPINVVYDSTRALVFCGSGGGVYIIDVSDVFAPRKVSERIHTRGDIHGLFYDNTTRRLYIGDGPVGVEIWSIQEPENPTKLGWCKTPFFAHGLAVSGNYAYVTNEDSGLYIVDITDPSNLRGISSYSIPHLAIAVVISGNYAYVVNGIGVEILDITDSLNPRRVGTYLTPTAQAIEVEVIGNYAYVVDWESGLEIVDISIPSNPRKIGNYIPSGGARAVDVIGNYAYVAYIPGVGSGLDIVDISDPSNPRRVSSHMLSWGFFGEVVVSGNYIYIATQCVGLYIVDIANPLSPSEVSMYRMLEHTLDVEVSNNYAYLVSCVGGLRIIDITTPSNPIGVTPGGARNIAVSGNYAYVADWDSGVRVIDIRTPSSPREVGFYKRPSTNVCGIAISGNYAYVADFGVDGGMFIVDISNPLNPREVGSYIPPHRSGTGVAISGRYAYLGTHLSGVHVVDISIPSNPTRAGFYDTPGGAHEVAVAGDLVYVADFQTGLQIYKNLLTGIEKEKSLSDYGVRLINNPASDGYLRLYIGTTDREEINFVIFNLAGQVVMEFGVMQIPSNKEVNLPISNLVHGIYFIYTKPKISEIIKFVLVK